MSPVEPQPAATPDPAAPAVRDLAAELLAAVRQAAAPPLLLDGEQVRAFAGISKSGLYRLLGADQFPRPVEIPGVGPRWRRTDVEKWVCKLRSKRRAAISAE